jgi:hypothetical protein
MLGRTDLQWERIHAACVSHFYQLQRTTDNLNDMVPYSLRYPRGLQSSAWFSAIRICEDVNDLLVLKRCLILVQLIAAHQDTPISIIFCN